MNVGYSHSDSNPDVNKWILNFNPRPNALRRLFCLPYAGSSSAIVYRKWTSDLPSTVEVLPIELPGRGARLNEPLRTDIIPLAQEIAEILSAFNDKPFEIFGHSMGSLLGFEVSKILIKKYKLAPRRLYVSAHGAPFLKKKSPIMHKLTENEFRLELKNLKGMDEDILNNSELMEIFSPIIRADYAVCETYTYVDEKIDIPLIAFGGEKDSTVSEEHLLAWEKLTSSEFKIFMFPGDHFYIMKDQIKFLKFFENILEE